MKLWLQSLCAVLGFVVVVGQAAATETLQWSTLPALPDKHGFAAPFSGVSDDALIVGGGANFPDGYPWDGGKKVFHDRIFVLNSPEGNWQESVTRLPAPIGYGVSITLPTRNSVLCIGGNDATGARADVFEIIHANGQISLRQELPPLPVPATMACGALIGNAVYVAGGESGGITHRRFLRLDVSAKAPAWEELPWPAEAPGRILAVAGARDGRFYMFSGCDLGSAHRDGRTYLQDAWAFTPGTKTWKRLADLPRQAAAAPSPALAVGASHFLVMGGSSRPFVEAQRVVRPALDGAGVQHPGFPNDILAYHVLTNTWTTCGEVPRPAPVTTPTVAWKGRTIVPTGEIHPGIRSPQILSSTVKPGERDFGAWNWMVVAAYLGGMVWVGAYFSRREQSTDNFFRGGQRIPWWAAGLSIFATMLSSITFMAIPAKSYATDASWYLGQLMILLVVPLVVVFYLPYYRRLNVTSAYEYLEQRFNLPTRLVASFSFILFHVGRTAVVIYLPALALEQVSSIDVMTSILVIGVICIIYTVMGGIEAVIWTDAVQAVVLMGGALLCLWLVFSRVDGGVMAVWQTAQTDAKLFQSLTADLSFRPDTTSGIVIALAFFFNALVPYTSGQDVVQRYVTTPTEDAAARSLWLTMWMAVFCSAVFFALGVALYAFYKIHPGQLDPGLVKNDGILPFFIMQQIPVGLAGFVIAAIFAAAQSTISSSLNSVATAYVTDFHARVLRPGNPDRANLRVARIIVVAVGLAGVVLAGVMARSDIQSTFEKFNALIGLTAGPLGGLFALGIFNPRANGRGALLGALFGFLAVVGLYISKAPVFSVLYALIGFTTCLLAGSVASAFLPCKGVGAAGSDKNSTSN